jgi:hypothetical protein
MIKIVIRKCNEPDEVVRCEQFEFNGFTMILGTCIIGQTWTYRHIVTSWKMEVSYE